MHHNRGQALIMVSLRLFSSLLFALMTLLSMPSMGRMICIGEDGHIAISQDCPHCEDCDGEETGGEDCQDYIAATGESRLVPSGSTPLTTPLVLPLPPPIPAFEPSYHLNPTIPERPRAAPSPPLLLTHVVLVL